MRNYEYGARYIEDARAGAPARLPEPQILRRE